MAGGSDWALPAILPWWPRRPDRSLDPAPLPTWVDERGMPSIGLRRRLAPHRFLQLACRLIAADPIELAGGRRFPEIVRQRELIAGLGIERWGQGPKRLGEVLGRSADTVGRWAYRSSKRRQADEAFRAAYETLDRTLMKVTASDSQ